MKIDRNRLKFAIRAQVQPSVSIHAAGLLDTDRTLTKSNVLHQSQRPKWFYARWQAKPGKYFPFRILKKNIVSIWTWKKQWKVYPCFFCSHVLLKQQKKMRLKKRPSSLSLFFLEWKPGKQSCCGHMCDHKNVQKSTVCKASCGSSTVIEAFPADS